MSWFAPTDCRRPARALPAAAAAILATALPALATTPTYTLTDLSALGFQTVNAINDAGDLAGSIAGPGGHVGAVYRNGSFHTFTGIAAANSTLTGINNAGQVIGFAQTSPNDFDYFAADASATFNLDQLAGATAVAHSINNSGTVVGNIEIAGTNHAFAYSFGASSVTDLGTLGGTSAVAVDVNDAGTISGDVYFGTGPTGRTFTYAVAPPSLLPAPAGFTRPTSAAINAAGQIAGTVSLPSGGVQAFVFDSGSYLYLGGADRYASSSASDLNDAGQVVGTLSGADPSAPFLFSDGIMHDLNKLVTNGTGWHLLWASDINNQGQIIGLGSLNGRPTYFLATPNASIAVPLPAAFCPALATLGACAAFAARRLRRGPSQATT